MNPQAAPLYEAMLTHHALSTVSFHVPGHKGRSEIDPAAKDFYAWIMALDYTEIPGLDDLHQPTGPIAEAQALAAACFGAEESYFLVNGSTVGNLAMILAVCSRNDQLILQRSVHKSVLHGLMLAGAQAVFLPEHCDASSGLNAGVRREDIVRAMTMYPEAKGVFLTNPNYYGMGIVLSGIAEDAHARGMVLLVDEAHGAHYGLHPDIPAHAMSCGADAVVQSTHKMLTAMTMGAMLHLQGKRINRSLIRQALAMLQSSSPSYPIMASLDLCRRWLHVYGQAVIEEGLQVIRRFHQELLRRPALAVFDLIKQPTMQTSYTTLDPFKVALCDRTGRLSGFQLKQLLAEAGCIAEMADPRYVLLLCSIATTSADMDRLLTVLEGIAELMGKQVQSQPAQANERKLFPQYDRISLPIPMELPQNISAQTIEEISLSEAIGRYAGESIIPYPPGIPILFYGEMINASVVAYLMELVAMGASFHGAADSTLKQIKVLSAKEHLG